MADGNGRRIYDVVVEDPIMVPMRDGVRLATKVYRPALGGEPLPGPFPVILERTPYHRHRHFLHLTGLMFARHGYVCVIQDVRGRYDSEGDFAFLFNENDEGRDGWDCLEWIGAQPWCNGKVGTIGLSYSGMTQQALAVLNPPLLASQFIMDCGINYWVHPMRQNGAFNLGILLPYVFRMSRDGHEAQADPNVAKLLDEDYRHVVKYLDRLPIKRGATPLAYAPTYEDWFFKMMTLSDYGDFWRSLSGNQEDYLDNWKDVPVCFVAGWYGHHIASNFRKYAHLKKRFKSPVKLIIGPWTHSFDMLQSSWAGEVDFGLEAVLGELNQMRLLWFDETLRGYEAGWRDSPGIRYFMMGGGNGRKNGAWRLQHGGRWYGTEEWPPPGSTPVPFYLHGDGSLRPHTPPAEPEAASTFTFDPRDPVPTIGGSVQNPGVPGFIDGGPYDQRGRPDQFAACKDDLPLATRPDVLVFQTPPLEEDVEVTGEITVKLWVSSSARDTDFTVKLIDVYPPNPDYPSGFAMNLVDGIVRMRYRNGRRVQELITPGEVYEVELSLHSTSNLFQKGHRIRVDISSSNFPLFDVNPNTGGPLGIPGGMEIARNIVYHDRSRPSHIMLPIMNRRDGAGDN